MTTVIFLCFELNLINADFQNCAYGNILQIMLLILLGGFGYVSISRKDMLDKSNSTYIIDIFTF